MVGHAWDTISDFLRHHGRHSPNAPALLAEGFAPQTYEDLSALLDRTRERLNGLGYGREDRIAIFAADGPVLAALVLGVSGCATAVPMNPELSAGELAIYLRDLKVQAVAVDTGLDTAARIAAQEIGLPLLEVECTKGRNAGIFEIRSTGISGKSARVGAASSDDLALLLTTSGTTSRFKVVPVSHRQLLTKIERNAKAFALTSSDRCLNLMPLFHAAGLYTALCATMYSGGSLISPSEYSVSAFFRLLESHTPTWCMGSFTFHHAIRAAAASHAAEIESSRLRFVRAASGHLDSRVARELEEILGTPVIETYATTETGFICSNPLPPSVRKPGTVGISVGGEVAVMGAHNERLAAGRRGEVVVHTANVFTGYENDPAANADSFVDGWFRTGDEGFFDEEGYLTLTGRIKDIINRGGEKIAPSEIDTALMSHPDVATAVTFPIPHPTLGQEVAAAVVPVDGAIVTKETVLRHLRGKLAGFKLPRIIVIAEEIPKGATGKYRREDLAEAFGLMGV